MPQSFGRALNRRRFLQLSGSAALVASVGLLAGCGEGDADPTTPPDVGAAPTDAHAAPTAGTAESVPTSTTAASAPTVAEPPKGTLRVAAGGDNYRRDENRANIGFNLNVFESLVRIAPDYQLEPLLATAWEFVEPNTWRFELREGVVFHDGTPFTAEAVKWSLGRTAKAGGGVVGVDEESVVIIDDLTVEITPARTNLRLVQQLGHPGYGVVAPNSEPAEVRIGTGPFKEVAYTPEDRYVSEAFADYWGAAPRSERIEFRFMPDPTTRLLALQSGEVDLAIDIAREAASSVQSAPGLQLVTSPVGAYEAIYIAIHGQAPYDLGSDPKLREAIAYAIDKQSIVDGVWQGNAEPSNTMIPDRILGSAGERVIGTVYAPERARSLLEEAGWAIGAGNVREKDGRRLALTLVVGYPTAEVHGPMPEFVQAQLAEVGIELQIVQTPDTATYETRLAAGEGDLWAEAGNQNDANPCFLPDLLFYSPDPDAPDASNSYANLFAPGAIFDGFIDACRQSITSEEVQAAAADAMHLLIDEEFVVVPLAGTFRIYGLTNKVEGFVAHPSGQNQRWTDVWVAG